MAKTSKGVILSQASQIKSDYSFALIKATADNKSLVQDASSAELKVNALVEYSKDSQWDPKKLTSLGFPAGCFLIIDLRGQDIHATDLITNLALVRQYGYQAGAIDDLSTLDDIKVLKANQIYLINSGKANDDQDASLNGDEITDGSGKLAVGMSVKWQRDYTNVDVSGDHAGFVGMGQDTLLKGGNAFGYSTNGRDFNAVITPKGLIFRRSDAERMWRLLKPNEIADINSTVGDKVKKEVDSATAEIPAAVSAANSAVSAAESAVAASKVNSDAIVAQSEAISEAKSAMDSATAEIQKNSTDIDQTNQKISLKADQTEVDQVKQTATQNSSRLNVMAGEISSKVTSTDVNNIVDKKGYATTSTVQSLIAQKAGKINESITSLDSKYNTTVTQVQQITASIDGLQSTVASKADKSQITQLSNLVQSKVSSSDFNNLRKAVDLQTLDSADINNMKTNGHYFVHNLANNPIGGWVYVDVTGNGADRIRQDVYQDNGSQHKYRRWFETSWTDWSQGATESEITQLRDDINLRVKSGDLLSQINIQAGRTLIQSQKIYMDANSVIMGPNTRAFIPSAAITNIDADKINAGTLNGVELRQVATNGRTIDIKDGNIVISSSDSSSGRITFVNGGKVTKVFNAKGDLETLDQYLTLFDFKSSDVNSQNPIPYFSVVNTGEIGSGDTKIQFDHSWINGNSWWTKAAGVTFGRTYDGTDGSGDYAEIYAKSFNQNSELSAKTRIEKLDKKVALDKIMQDDMYTYQYKSDVRDGSSKRYASFIIDNVNDVAQYREPAEFLSANRHGRDDGTQLAYLIAAFQYQHGVIAEMQKEIEELKQGTAEK